MKTHLSYLLILFFSLASCKAFYAKDDISARDSIACKLIQAGFENVRINVDETRYMISYENRIMRFDVDAIKEVIKIVAPIVESENEIVLVPLNRKIPLVALKMQINDCKNYLNNELSGEEFAERMIIDFDTDDIVKEIESNELENSSSYRFDVVLKPSLNLEFGPFSQPVMYQVNIIPELRTSLWKGMSIGYEMIVPIYNEFGSRQDSVRPGIVALNQTYRFSDGLFFSSSLGMFSQERYGLDIETKKYFLNGNMSLGLNYGLTSYISFSGIKKFFYSKVFTWTGTINIEYRLPIYDLTFGMAFGKYLHGDKTMRLDMNREFDEFEIGLFVLKSANGISNGGINISIPLFPSKYMKPGLFRITPGESFERSYLVRSNVNDLIGLRYNTGNRLERFTKKLNPSFIKNVFREN